MALHDLTERRASVHVGGRIFTVRPVSVLGVQRAQEILASCLPRDEAVAKGWLEELKKAAAGWDPAAAVSVLARLYLAILENIGKDQLCALLALVCEPGAEELLAAIDADPPGAPAAFLRAVAELHDFGRILRKFTEKSTEPIPAFLEESEGLGLETVILDVATFLPQYRLEDILAWPYERFLTVQEQMGALRAIRSGKPARIGGQRPAASNAELRAIGVTVQTRRKKPGPSQETVH